MPVDEHYIIRFDFDRVRDNLKDIESNITNSVANATASGQSTSSGMGMIGIGFGRMGRIRLPRIRLNAANGVRPYMRQSQMSTISARNDRTILSPEMQGVAPPIRNNAEMISRPSIVGQMSQAQTRMISGGGTVPVTGPRVTLRQLAETDSRPLQRAAIEDRERFISNLAEDLTIDKVRDRNANRSKGPR